MAGVESWSWVYTGRRPIILVGVVGLYTFVWYIGIKIGGREENGCKAETHFFYVRTKTCDAEVVQGEIQFFLLFSC